MATLESLRLSGWKSIKDTEPPITFRRLNVLVGANGAGKSNLVSFFRLLSEMMAGQLQEFVRIYDGPDSMLHFGIKHTKSIAAELDFGTISYGFVLRLNALGNALLLDEEKIQFPAKTPSGIEI